MYRYHAQLSLPDDSLAENLTLLGPLEVSAKYQSGLSGRESNSFSQRTRKLLHSYFSQTPRIPL